MPKPESTSSLGKILLKFSPFWLFMVLFKFGGGLHYSLLSPLGERLMPLWIVGLLMGGSSLVQLLLDVPAGHILDRYGYRRFLKFTTLCFLLSAAFLIVPLTETTYLLSLFFSIFGWLFFGPGVSAYILSSAPSEKSGAFISMRDVSGSIGIVLASASLPFVLLFAQPHIGLILFLVLASAFVVVCFAPKDHERVSITQRKFSSQHFFIRRRFYSIFHAIGKLNPASTMLLLLNLTSGIFYGVIWFVVPLVIAHQANSTLLGVGLGIFDFSVVVLGFMLGILADRLNKRRLVFFGLLIFSFFGVLIGFNFGWLFLLFGFFATSGEEMAALSLWSWLHTLDKEHASDGAISGVINLFEDFGWMVGPAVAGISYELFGPSLTIVLGALPIFIVWIIYQLSFRTHVPHSLSLRFLPPRPLRKRHKS